VVVAVVAVVVRAADDNNNILFFNATVCPGTEKKKPNKNKNEKNVEKR